MANMTAIKNRQKLDCGYIDVGYIFLYIYIHKLIK